ncbi:MAG: hypothetical protein E7163_02070 [Firmicutes bacterium]|nr:hypothetical protein [Bacillota bacterium]
MDNVVYQEEFVKSSVGRDPESISYVLNQIKECHPKDYGWVVSDPEIIPNNDGKTVTLKVKLTKYEIKQGYSR